MSVAGGRRGVAPPGAERLAAIDAVFDEALDVGADQRAAWLARRCGDDADLAREVSALLAAHERPARILDTPVAALAAALVQGEPPARCIGPYRVLRELGRGGMGVVYLAERSDGQFKRRVAVKLLRASPDADELHRRFLAERQILASLSHPNIAQLLDGGVAEGQLPFLVIEHVDGLPITEYCDRQRLGVEERLRLFQDVCAAVHHAHRNLVLHRDLKPGNILVTTEGEVKLLDFGIAKLLNPNASAADVPVTRTAFRMMTPAYASPEQVRGDSLTTASDVYALGLVLYELLTGAPAQTVGGESVGDVVSAVCEREPERPSNRVLHGAQSADAGHGDAVGAARGAPPLRLARQLRGDLDAIVMMALRKEATRRYGSAELLAADIGRHLDGLPVLAHRGSGWYRATKFLRRHARAAAAGALIALSLVAGASAAIWQAGIAARERDRATAALAESQDALRQSEEVTNFLVGLFEASTPIEGRQDTLTSIDLLRRGTARAERLSDEPLVQARMFDALGRVQLSLGNLAEGDRFMTRALAIRQRLLGTRDVETAASASRLADVWRRRGAYAAADSLATIALATNRALLGPTSPEVATTLRQVSGIAIYRGDLERARRLMQEAIVIRRSGARPDDSLTVKDLQDLGAVLWRGGHIDEGLARMRESIEVARGLDSLPNRLHGSATARLAQHLSELPDHRVEAESLMRAGYAELRSALGATHPATASAQQQLARLLSWRGAHAEAEAMQRASLAVVRQSYGPRHAETAYSMSALSGYLLRAGRVQEAEALSRAVLQLWAEVLGRRHSVYAGALGNLAHVLEARGALDSAALLHREAIAIRQEAVGQDNSLVAVTSLGLARTLIAQRRFVEADSILRWSLANIVRQNGEAHPDAMRTHAVMARLYAAWGRADDAARHRRQARGLPPEASSF